LLRFTNSILLCTFAVQNFSKKIMDNKNNDKAFSMIADIDGDFSDL